MYRNATEEDIRTALSTVIDPELHLPITDMGLIYGIDIGSDGSVTITMTLTTIGCPLFETIHADIMKAVRTVPGVTDADIDLTFDPPWSPEMMSDTAKAELGLP